MKRVFELLAERRIAEALARGDLEHLPGAGRPLVFDDDPLVPAEQRMFSRVLRQAGFVPNGVLLRKEIAELRREIAALRREIAALPPGERRDAVRRHLLELVLRIDESREL
ncbi:DUF1992 domain-containing protein [Dechloromonas sp. H13]|uniref:DnaJ family domain-containing protein n=1 Tax=Dechloromonas sp. H13 TaxID=2570193 RepID=UPI001291AB24|nr:DUF1992 domain-containing protein [Dechloromonas sp. H13]